MAVIKEDKLNQDVLLKVFQESAQFASAFKYSIQQDKEDIFFN